MIIAGKFEVPDKCPENCPHINEPAYQGSICSRCPIFNCKKDDTGFCLIEPEGYREDWAEYWQEAFKQMEKK